MREQDALISVSNKILCNCLAGGSLCCGLAFSSRGMVAAGDEALKKLIAAIEKVKFDLRYFAHLHIDNSAAL